MSLLVATEVHGKSPVGKLVQSECSDTGHSSFSWNEVLEGPLLVVAVLAVPPGKSVAISEGPSVWGQAPGVHLDVAVGSGQSLISSVLPDREGNVSSSSDSKTSLASEGKVALALKSDGRGSGVEDHVRPPVSDARGEGDLVEVASLMLVGPNNPESSVELANDSEQLVGLRLLGLLTVEGPSLLWSVPAMCPNQVSTVSWLKSFWSQARVLHLDVMSMSLDSLLVVVRPLAEGDIRLRTVACVQSNSHVLLVAVSQGDSSSIEEESRSPAVDLLGGDLGKVSSKTSSLAAHCEHTVLSVDGSDEELEAQLANGWHFDWFRGGGILSIEVDDPREVWCVGARPQPESVSISVEVWSLVVIWGHAVSGFVLDVPVCSCDEVKPLGVVEAGVVRSHFKVSSVHVVVALLVGDDVSPLGVGPDDSSSRVEHPVSSVSEGSLVSLNGQVVSVSMDDSGVVGDHSASWQSRLDEESSSVSDWVLNWSALSVINVPKLVDAVVASPPGQVSVFNELEVGNVETMTSEVSEVSWSVQVSVESNLLSDIASEWRNDSIPSNLGSVASLVGDGVVPVGSRSHGSGSGVVGELLVGVPWLSSGVDLKDEVSVNPSRCAPLNSELPSVSQNDREHLTVLVWEGWSALGPGSELPELVASESVVAMLQDDGLSVSVGSSVEAQATEVGELVSSVDVSELLRQLVLPLSDDDLGAS